MYGTAQTFALALERERFTRTEESGGDTLDLLNDCDLLIIDDLGMEISSSYITATIYNVIDTRITLKKPTIMPLPGPCGRACRLPKQTHALHG